MFHYLYDCLSGTVLGRYRIPENRLKAIRQVGYYLEAEMNDYLFMVLGILCAYIGSETFLRGTVGIAYWARISPAIVGVTVAAFATSSPELAVSIRASAVGIPQI